MTNYEILIQLDWEGNPYEIVRINRGNNEFTSMLKSTYDAMQAEQSTPNLAD
jgi:hypothetical protein